jgi:hypothetical protein
MYQEWRRGVDLKRFHGDIYAGSIVRFSELSAMRAIVERARLLLEEHFFPFEPEKIHLHYSVDQLAVEISKVQRIYGQAADIQALWRALFEEVGFDPDQVARDRLILRFQPHLDPRQPISWNRSTATVAFHRDTWGTNLYSQVNWWAPIYRLAPGRTLHLYPELWAKPIANNSQEFDIVESLRRIRDAPASIGPQDMIPTLLDTIDQTGASPVLIEPGSIIAFSAQHAHAAVPNSTGLTRISVETRTLAIADLAARRGAPNTDGSARWKTPGLFRRLSDGVPLPTVIGVEAVEPFTRSVDLAPG